MTASALVTWRFTCRRARCDDWEGGVAVDGAFLHRWTGVKPDGTAATGAMTIRRADLAAITKDRFDVGWRSLEVTFGAVVVAAIGRDPGPAGRRTWWAES